MYGVGFYRTSASAEVNLIFDMPGHGLWAIDIKRNLAPRPAAVCIHVQQDLTPDRTFIVYPGRSVIRYVRMWKQSVWKKYAECSSRGRNARFANERPRRRAPWLLAMNDVTRAGKRDTKTYSLASLAHGNRSSDLFRSQASLYAPERPQTLVHAEKTPCSGWHYIYMLIFFCPVT